MLKKRKKLSTKMKEVEVAAIQSNSYVVITVLWIDKI